MAEKAFEVSLQPEQVEAGQPAKIIIKNQSEAEASFSLSLSSTEDALEFRWGRNQTLQIPAGEDASVEYSAVPRKPPWVGGARSYPFSVTVNPEGGESQTRNGEVLGIGLLPTWLAGIVVVLCVALIAVGVISRLGSQLFVAQVTQTPALQTAVATVVGSLDTDSDGLTNEEEVALGTDPELPDTDSDQLNDGEEVNDYGTDPLNEDTDRDSVFDGQEVLLGSDPLSPDDTDGDGLLNSEEDRLGTDPLNVDTDGDGLEDGEEIASGSDPLDASSPGKVTAAPTEMDTPPTEASQPTTPAESTPEPGGQATPAPTSLPTVFDEGSIAFESDRDGNRDIYLLDTGTGAVTRLTEDPAEDTQPALSPDGERIAFVTDRDGNREIYVMNLDGSGMFNLTSNPADDEFPSWATNSRQIAFSSDRSGNQDIFVVEVPEDGAQVEEPTQVTTDPADEFDPSWLGAQEMLYTSNKDGNQEIYWVSLDGSGPTNFTNDPAEDFASASSPNGQNFSFTSNRDGDLEVYFVSINRLDDPINLTLEPSADDLFSSWSTDGGWIAFATNRDGDSEIYALDVQTGISATGTEAINVTGNQAEDQFPSWQNR